MPANRLPLILRRVAWSVLSLGLVWTAHAQTPAFPTAVAAAHPVGYWRLNETNKPVSGTVVAADEMNKYNGKYGTASADGVSGPTLALGFPGLETNNAAAEFTNGV